MKEELINRWDDWFTEWSAIITFAGITSKELQDYLYEPYVVRSYRDGFKFIRDKFEPALWELKKYLREKSTSEWQNLHMLQPGDAALRKLTELKNNVKQVWTYRPRFPADKGRRRKF